jgi:hypothetical protein
MPSATHPCLPKTKGGYSKKALTKRANGRSSISRIGEGSIPIDYGNRRVVYPGRGGVGSVSSQVGSGDGNPSGDHQSRPEVRP